MNRAIELHDSSIKLIIPDGPNTTIELEPAYLHESEGTPGVDPGEGYLQNIHIQLSDCTIHSTAIDLPARINDGSISLSGELQENVVRLPLIHLGNVDVDIHTDKGEYLKLTAGRVIAVLVGDREHLEKVSNGAAS